MTAFESNITDKNCGLGVGMVQQQLSMLGESGAVIKEVEKQTGATIQPWIWQPTLEAIWCKSMIHKSTTLVFQATRGEMSTFQFC